MTFFYQEFGASLHIKSSMGLWLQLSSKFDEWSCKIVVALSLRDGVTLQWSSFFLSLFLSISNIKQFLRHSVSTLLDYEAKVKRVPNF